MPISKLELAKKRKEQRAVEKAHTEALLKSGVDAYVELKESIEGVKHVVNVKAVDTVQEYRPANVLAGEPNSYYGFLHPTGKWYIMRQSGATDASFKYVAGIKNYDDAWRVKENHRYVPYNEVSL